MLGVPNSLKDIKSVTGANQKQLRSSTAGVLSLRLDLRIAVLKSAIIHCIPLHQNLFLGLKTPLNTETNLRSHENARFHLQSNLASNK